MFSRDLQIRNEVPQLGQAHGQINAILTAEHGYKLEIREQSTH